MKYDFVEIGCSIWNTYIDKYGLSANGLLVEPVPNIFSAVPSSDTVRKENSAITNYDGTIEMFTYGEFLLDFKYKYLGDIPLSETHSIPTGWAASSIDLNNVRRKTINGKIIVNCLTLKSLFEKYDVSEIDYFKVDAEGHDHIILKDLIKIMMNGFKVNKEIIFEYGYDICNKKQLDRLCDILEKKFLFKKHSAGADIVLSYM